MAQIKIFIIGAALVAMLGAGTAAADETGFSDMHAQAKVGGKICMLDHSHHGASEGQPSRKAAEVAAMRHWSSFTDFEYGSDWASFANATGKSISCGQSNGAWACSIDARPCRLATRSAGKARR